MLCSRGDSVKHGVGVNRSDSNGENKAERRYQLRAKLARSCRVWGNPNKRFFQFFSRAKIEKIRKCPDTCIACRL